MRISINLKAVLTTIVLCQFVSGCSTKTTPLPGSDKVKLISNAANNCKKLGVVNSSDYSRVSLDQAEKSHQSNIVVLKNNAAALGANAIILSTHATDTRKEISRAGNERVDSDIYTHNLMGTAYYCR